MIIHVRSPCVKGSATIKTVCWSVLKNGSLGIAVIIEGDIRITRVNPKPPGNKWHGFIQEAV
jgi:hypothetical protein